jgi:mono/diheme cytochrome c family protein
MFLLRRWRRPLARLALGAFLCAWMLPFYEAHPLGFDDDAACLVVSGDASAPLRLSAPGRDEGQPAHCVVCHLIRALGGAVASNGARLAAPAETASGLLLIGSLTLPAVHAAPSSRGPPVLPTI